MAIPTSAIRTIVVLDRVPASSVRTAHRLFLVSAIMMESRSVKFKFPHEKLYLVNLSSSAAASDLTAALSETRNNVCKTFAEKEEDQLMQFPEKSNKTNFYKFSHLDNGIEDCTIIHPEKIVSA